MDVQPLPMRPLSFPRQRLVWLIVCWTGIGQAAILFAQADSAPATFRQPFDGPQTAWQRWDQFPSVRILEQQCVGREDGVTGGVERIAAVCPPRSRMMLSCRTGRIPVIDELHATLWIQSNRPEVQLAARVVLPRSRGPSPGMPATALVLGDAYQSVGQWRQLRLADVPTRLGNVVRAVHSRSKTKLDPREAYVDAIVLLVPGGRGTTILATDDLVVDGVAIPTQEPSTPPSAPVARTDAPETPASSAGPLLVAPAGRQESRRAPGRIAGTTLLVNDRPFLPRIIRSSGEPFELFANLGFNVVLLEGLPTPQETAEARRFDLWLLAPPPSPEELPAWKTDDPLERVLGWYWSREVAAGEMSTLSHWAEALRERDPLGGRPLIAEAEFNHYALSKLVDVIVVHRNSLPKSSASEWSQWFGRVRMLATPGTPVWLQVSTQPSAEIASQAAALAADLPPSASLDRSDVEMQMWTAASNEARGLLFDSRTSLITNDQSTRRRALALQRINRKLDIIEPWLASGNVVGKATSNDKSWTGVMLQLERANLLIPDGAQKPAVNEHASTDGMTSMVLPGVPESNQAHIVSLAGVRPIPHKRVAGGIRITLNPNAQDFLLFTEDPQIVGNVMQRTARTASVATNLSRQLAIVEHQFLSALAGQLQRWGINDAESGEMLRGAQLLIQRSSVTTAGKDPSRAFQDSEAALRLLAQAGDQFRKLVAGSDPLESSPLAASSEYFPQLLAMRATTSTQKQPANVLYGGDFEDIEQVTQSGWRHVGRKEGGIQTNVELSAEQPKHGQYCLLMSAGSSPDENQPSNLTEPLIWITSPEVYCESGQAVEITGWVRVSESEEKDQVEWLSISDTLGGADLALQVGHTKGWKPFRMIRGSGDEGAVQVTFSLSGFGAVAIDAVMIRPIPSRGRTPTVSNASTATPSGPLLTSPALFGTPNVP